MRDNIRSKQQSFELALGAKQVAACLVVALIVLGAAFALGLGVGRKSGGGGAQAIPAFRDALARLDDPIAAKEEPPPELTAHQALTDSRSIEKTMPVPAVNVSKASATPAPHAEERIGPEQEIVMPPAIAAPGPISPPAHAGTATSSAVPAMPAKPAAAQAGSATSTAPMAQPARKVARETKPAPAETARSAALRPKPNGKGKATYTIQIASAPHRADAERVARQLAARRPRIVAADVPGKGRWYRVQIGSYDSRESAKLALLSMSGVHGVVTPAGR
jgi:DedD protein